MSVTITSREFNRDVFWGPRGGPGGPRESGPVTITDHGRRSHVLMTVEDFDRLTAGKELLGDRLWRGQDPDIELPLPERGLEPPRGLDL
jgi:prevent-host-death family protein